jgi:glyoxylase-like metal-dependent hydrolase (beta-lactamase superfamily II)/rhodanese-related sulfurtransferase
VVFAFGHGSDIIARRFEAIAENFLVPIFRQMFDPASSTYTYLLADGGEAVLIDPVFEQVRRDAALIEELDLNLVATLETHVHADHVTGAWLLKRRFGSAIAVSGESGAEGADRYLKDGERISFGMRSLGVRATPGHTRGCVTYVLDGEEMAFTGDCLLIRGCGRIDFQGGDASAMFRSVRERIFSLPDDCPIFPAHDYRGLTSTSVGEERAFNPRLGDALSESEFALYMGNLGLAHPKLMDAAVPANLKCGRVEGQIMADPDWAPLTYNFAGFWEIEPRWVEENASKVQILDVREPDEFTGPLGHIHGAKLIPLGTLGSRTAELSKDVPIVAVCRVGGRSAQAVNILKQAGFDKLANLPGGMMRWRQEGLKAE